MKAQFFRFLSIGAAATGLQYVLLILGVEAVGLGATSSSAGGFALSALFNYWANYHFTFRSRQSHQVALPRFALIAAFGLLLNSAIVYIGTAKFAVHYVFAQILATIIVLFWNFLANRQWTFKPQEARSQ